MLDDLEVTVNYVDYAPGHVGVPHRHTGFVLVYVLEGTVIAKISGQARSRLTPPARCSTNNLVRPTKSRRTRVRHSLHGCLR